MASAPPPIVPAPIAPAATRCGPFPRRAARGRGGRAMRRAALWGAVALAAVVLAGRPPALAQGLPPAEGGRAAPVGTPGGLETTPRPLPAGPVDPDVTPGPEIADPGPDAALVPDLAGPLGAPSEAVGVPDLGEAGEAIGAAEDLDPGRALDLDPLGLGLDGALGRPGRIAAPVRDPFLGPVRAGGRAAERAPGGLTLTFGLGLRLRVEDDGDLGSGDGDGGGDDGDGGAVELVADLAFGALSQTRTQRIAVDLDTGLALGSAGDEGSGLELEEPRLAFAFEREGARARVGAALRYARIDLDEARLADLDRGLDELPEADELVVSGGRRTELDAELELVAGLGRPVGFELELRAERRGFEDVDDPDLTDRDIYEAEGALRLDAMPRLVTRLTFDLTTLDDDSGEERDTRALGVSAVYAASGRTTLTAALGGSRIEALRGVDLDDDGEDDARRRSERNGAVGSLGIVHELPLGTLSAELESELEENGRRDTLRVARAFELRRGTGLSASLGATRGAIGETELVADVALARELARGALSASLARRAGTNADGESVASTFASLGLRRELSRLSSLTLDLDVARVEGLGEGRDDERRTELRLAFVRALTPDWSLAAGVEHQRRREGGEDDASSALFVALGREFTIRP